MCSIQAFWLAAVSVAVIMATSPLGGSPPMSFARVSTRA